MNDEKLSEALGFVARHLAADGVFHANVNVGGREPGAWQEFPVMWRSLPCYERHALEAGLAVEDIGSLAELGHQSGIPAQDDQRMLRFRTM